MNIRSIASAGDISGKKALVRVDFNVELSESQNTAEHFKIKSAKDTIDFLFQQGVSKIALLTHLGRPEGRDNAYSVRLLEKDVETALGRPVIFVDDCVGENVTKAINSVSGEALVLLENIRFYKEEELNDEHFAKQLAESFDLFVNEAFSVSHRAHASVEAITKCLPSFAGLHLVKEIEQLQKVQFNPKHPAVAVIGGAKIETKLPLIRAFEKEYDFVLVGGKIANEAIDQNIEFSDKVILPEDFQGEQRFDIGPKTMAHFADIIAQAKTIVWNGPIGKFEEPPYDSGTKEVVRAIMRNASAHVVIGGGESITAIEKEHALNSIGFVSTGGGAMLEFLGGKKLPGLEVLKVDEE